jgi:single-strand DNA-binding protein
VNDSFGIGAILFGEAAERKAGTLHKGQAVIIEGRLQSREWDNKDNQRRKVVEIVASRVHSLEPQAKSEGEPSTGDSEPMPLPEPVDDVPF